MEDMAGTMPSGFLTDIRDLAQPRAPSQGPANESPAEQWEAVIKNDKSVS